MDLPENVPGAKGCRRTSVGDEALARRVVEKAMAATILCGLPTGVAVAAREAERLGLILQREYIPEDDDG